MSPAGGGEGGRAGASARGGAALGRAGGLRSAAGRGRGPSPGKAGRAAGRLPRLLPLVFLGVLLSSDDRVSSAPGPRCVTCVRVTALLSLRSGLLGAVWDRGTGGEGERWPEETLVAGWVWKRMLCL